MDAYQKYLKTATPMSKRYYGENKVILPWAARKLDLSYREALTISRSFFKRREKDIMDLYSNIKRDDLPEETNYRDLTAYLANRYPKYSKWSICDIVADFLLNDFYNLSIQPFISFSFRNIKTCFSFLTFSRIFKFLFLPLKL